MAQREVGEIVAVGARGRASERVLARGDPVSIAGEQRLAGLALGLLDGELEQRRGVELQAQAPRSSARTEAMVRSAR